MKRCKCINSEHFDKLGQQDYRIYVGDVFYYEIGDVIDGGNGVLQCVFEIKNNTGTLVYLIESDFNKSFIDLYQHRVNIINKLCN